MPELHNIENILQQVKVRVAHSKELSELNGEKFNIFSLLSIETNENSTHSRFLAELLNPKGTHGLKVNFLQKFIHSLPAWIKEDGNKILNNFDFNTATVAIEKVIGKRNDAGKTGGRVDIAISDKSGYSIFIENKIHAGDQNAQIERYCNYNKEKCIVLYLTLTGGEPSKMSKGKLVNGEDFYCISYKTEIVEWLNLCVKEAAEQPILRETIKQYLVLIKKLTGQLAHNKMNREIKKLILDNLESADIIAKNFVTAKEDLQSKVRAGLKLRLESEAIIAEKFKIKEHGKISDRNSKLWFYHKDLPESFEVFFGIEPFSGYGVSRNDLFVGFIDIHSRKQEYFLNDESNLQVTGWWRGVEFLTFEGNRIRLSDINLLQQIGKNPQRLNHLIEELAQQTMDYIERNEETLIRICKKSLSNIEPA